MLFVSCCNLHMKTAEVKMGFNFFFSETEPEINLRQFTIIKAWKNFVSKKIPEPVHFKQKVGIYHI